MQLLVAVKHHRRNGELSGMLCSRVYSHKYDKRGALTLFFSHTIEYHLCYLSEYFMVVYLPLIHQTNKDECYFLKNVTTEVTPYHNQSQ